MFHSRRSRESKAVDSEALAAASAIGRALDSKGTKVNAEKLPRYNSLSRSNSMVRAASISSRNNSLRTRRDSRRSSSLQLKGPRARDSIDESEFYDAEDTFHAFGGAPTQTKPVTVKRYVPGPSGLKLVEVPISEVQKPPSRNSSMNRRSVSVHSGLSVRNNSLGRRASLNSHSSQKQKAPAPVAQKQKKEPVIRRSEIIENHKPLVEQSLKEETDEQLQLDRQNKEVVNPIELTPPSKNAAPEVSNIRSGDKQVEIVSKTVNQTNVNVSQQPPKVLISPPNEETLETQDRVGQEVTNPRGTEKEASKQSIMSTETVPESGIRGKKDANGKDYTGKTIEDSIKEVSSASSRKNATNSESGASAEGSGATSGNSMAKYIRSANQYLNKGHEKVLASAEESNAEGSEQQTGSQVTGNGNVEMAPLNKVPSPMKPALKKTASDNSMRNSYKENYGSKAEEAYISLATAENTRLNAQMSDEHSRRQPSVRKTRPSSMMTNTNTAQKNIPAVTKQKRLSMQTPLRSEIQPPARSTMRPESTRQNQKTKPKSRTRPQQTNNNKRAFYPPEPPQKRSSFEKMRPNETHMGFKKLSLRDDMSEEDNQGPVAGEMFHNVSTPVSTEHDSSSQVRGSASLPASNLGWKSRFHDSDSEDEYSPISKASPAKSKPIVPKTGAKNGGFSLRNKKDSGFAPPQPNFVQSSTAPNSKHNTPSKKISTLSLRSVSNKSEISPAKGKNNLNQRFFSEQLAPNVEEGETKKKSSFGKKLKKIFGRKK
ncbi:LAQU0S01e11254g1_1 [Lachancea quebecensis]|uniref:LAQU0S01e11254g1_1 n=1 Tax=Lachancea quebecensis TaxID=1654605 RepID=A0A0P1KML2_9SACH|nr:LAQU0S01e11254g1_1 [Lachancea quebecensis]